MTWSPVPLPSDTDVVPDPEGLLEAGPRLERTPTGTRWIEGPVWLPGRAAVRLSDIPGNRILEVADGTGEVSVHADPADFTNGRTLDLDGSVVECSHGGRAVLRDRGVGPGEPRRTEVLADRHGEARLNSPNDVIVASDGAIWFTDPSYGIRRPDEGHAGEEEYGDRYVFRLPPGGGRPVPVVLDVEAPNGLALSPDESTLYVADSSVSPADPDAPEGVRPRGTSIHAYDVVEGRHAKNGRTFVEVTPGPPDGVRVDERGNVWSTCATGLRVFAPDGTPVLRIDLPERPANLCFGGSDGRTLHVTASSHLYRVRVSVRDAAAVIRRRPIAGSAAPSA